jgi:hypothetical protein
MQFPDARLLLIAFAVNFLRVSILYADADHSDAVFIQYATVLVGEIRIPVRVSVNDTHRITGAGPADGHFVVFSADYFTGRTVFTLDESVFSSGLIRPSDCFFRLVFVYMVAIHRSVIALLAGVLNRICANERNSTPQFISKRLQLHPVWFRYKVTKVSLPPDSPVSQGPEASPMTYWTATSPPE